jgi:hypothetical protein
MRRITGMRRTTPTSKKSGIPSSMAMSAIAQVSLRSPAQSRMVPTMRSAPPDSARSRPSIAPSATRIPTLPRVAPKPFWNCEMTSVARSPEARPTNPTRAGAPRTRGT